MKQIVLFLSLFFLATTLFAWNNDQTYYQEMEPSDFPLLSLSADKSIAVLADETAIEIYKPSEQYWNQVKVLNPHKGIITAVLVSPNGQQLFATSEYGDLIAYNLQTYTPLFSDNLARRIGVSGVMGLGLALSEDANHEILAVGDSQGHLLFYKRVGSSYAFKAAYTSNRSKPYYAVSFSPDNRYLGIGTEGSMEIWRMDNPEQPPNFETSMTVADKQFYAVLFIHTSSGSILLGGDQKGQITAFNVNRQTLEKTLNFHAGPIAYLERSPEGTHFASISMDQSVAVWNAVTLTADMAYVRPDEWFKSIILESLYSVPKVFPLTKGNVIREKAQILSYMGTENYQIACDSSTTFQNQVDTFKQRFPNARVSVVHYTPNLTLGVIKALEELFGQYIFYNKSANSYEFYQRQEQEVTLNDFTLGSPFMRTYCGTKSHNHLYSTNFPPVEIVDYLEQSHLSALQQVQLNEDYAILALYNSGHSGKKTSVAVVSLREGYSNQGRTGNCITFRGWGQHPSPIMARQLAKMLAFSIMLTTVRVNVLGNYARVIQDQEFEAWGTTIHSELETHLYAHKISVMLEDIQVVSEEWDPVNQIFCLDLSIDRGEFANFRQYDVNSYR